MIKEILIINYNGVGLFYQNFEEAAQVDHQLLAGFFTAIQNFAKVFMEDKVDVIVSRNNQYSFYQGNDFSIVIKTDKGINAKIKEKTLQLRNLFLDVYKTFINQNERDIEIYNNFEGTVRKLFGIEIKTMNKSSEILRETLGISLKKTNFKKILDAL